MKEMMQYLLPFVTGIILGVLYYTGLWWTILKGLKSQNPGLLFISSWILRTIVVLAGMYLIADNNWKNILICLTGFIIARFVVMTFIRIITDRTTLHASE